MNHKLLITLIILQLFSLISCTTQKAATRDQMTELAEQSIWIYGEPGQGSADTYHKIANSIGEQDNLSALLDLLESSDFKTVQNISYLLDRLIKDGYIDNSFSEIIIREMIKIVTGDRADLKADAFVGIINFSNGYLIAISDERVLDEELSETKKKLIIDIVTSYSQALQDSNSDVVHLAAHDLHYFGSYAIVSIGDLRNLLDDEELVIRMSAGTSLAFIAPESSSEVVPVLIEGLNNLDMISERMSAIKALSMIGYKSDEVLRTLNKLAGDSNEALSQSAKEALRDLYPELELSREMADK